MGEGGSWLNENLSLLMSWELTYLILTVLLNKLKLLSFYLQSSNLVLTVLLNILKLFLLLPQSPYSLTYYNMSKGQAIYYTHLKVHSHDNPDDFLLVSALPRGWQRKNLMLAFPPLHLFV